MQKTIFSRYIRITMCIVVSGFILLGVIMMVFLSKYWLGENQKMLARNTNAVVAIVEKAVSFESKYEIEFPRDIIETSLKTYSSNNEINIILADIDGNVFLSSYAIDYTGEEVKKIDSELVDKIFENPKGYQENSTLYGIYNEKYFTVGMPVYTNIDGEVTPAAVAISSIKSSPITSFLKEAMEIFFVAAILVIIVCFFFVGLFSYSMVRPIRQMSEAVKAFGSGDFSVRVSVNSEDEIGQLATSFNEMANSLSSSEGMRRSFVANVSHELKTPMTTIAGFIDGILDGTIPEKDRDKYLSIVSVEVKRLSRLVKSMLDLSRIDSGEMRINPKLFDITNIVFTTLLTFEKPIEDKKIEIRGLENAANQEVYGDQDLLHQVVYNLIENAVKFTNIEGHITIAITDSIDRTVVSIENSGAGIEAEELPMIFDRFYKTDKSRSKDKNGMGLGLYIVKTIIQLHGGEITVSSRVNDFCKFEFYIPKKMQGIGQKNDNTGKIPVSRDQRDYEVYDAEIIEENKEDKNG